MRINRILSCLYFFHFIVNSIIIEGVYFMNKEEMNRIIGNLLKKHRIKNGYTQEKVAELLGLAPKYISQIERGISAGTIETLIKFCNLYNITTDAILLSLLNSNIKKSQKEFYKNFKNLCERDQKAIEKLIEYYLKN